LQQGQSDRKPSGEPSARRRRSISTRSEFCAVAGVGLPQRSSARRHQFALASEFAEAVLVGDFILMRQQTIDVRPVVHRRMDCERGGLAMQVEQHPVITFVGGYDARNQPYPPIERDLIGCELRKVSMPCAMAAGTLPIRRLV